jgi:hypothetical protein
VFVYLLVASMAATPRRSAYPPPTLGATPKGLALTAPFGTQFAQLYRGCKCAVPQPICANVVNRIVGCAVTGGDKWVAFYKFRL